MSDFNRKNHWENIYQTKELNEVSWYQPTPTTSLNFIHKMNISKDSKIIDIGGGDSFLVDNLLEQGYKNITVLDISEAAIQKAKIRLGKNASKINWIVSDITQFEPTEKYDFWHDRAVFHFLTNENDINKYLELVRNNLNGNGKLLIGTFSETGPTKCSGIEIKQYSSELLKDTFKDILLPEFCENINHPTPFDTVQNFTFCGFSKK